MINERDKYFKTCVTTCVCVIHKLHGRSCGKFLLCTKCTFSHVDGKNEAMTSASIFMYLFRWREFSSYATSAGHCYSPTFYWMNWSWSHWNHIHADGVCLFMGRDRAACLWTRPQTRSHTNCLEPWTATSLTDETVQSCLMGVLESQLTQWGSCQSWDLRSVLS